MTFLGNISYNSDFHSFIACDEILLVLYKKFFNEETTNRIKDTIQKILSNISFSKSVHENMIKQNCIEIFQSKCLSVQTKDNYIPPNSETIPSLIGLINIGLNFSNFYLIENEENFVNQLTLIKECDKPLQIKLLQAVIEYINDNQKEEQNTINKKKKIMIETLELLIQLLNTRLVNFFNYSIINNIIFFTFIF